jgi:hypothetical protein
MTPGGSPGPGGTPSPTPGAGNLGDSMSVPGTAPLRRLTKVELDNTLRDLLGITTSPARGNVNFTADQDSALAGFVRGGSITAPPDARLFMTTAEQVVTTAVQNLATLLPCSPLPTAVPEQDACADKFITGFARRAYRRPLAAAELDGLKALYRAQRRPEAGATFAEAVGDVITSILQSPNFLYRWELGVPATKDGALVKFNSHEMASRLSYAFWASMPDDKLFEAADGGLLATPAQIEQQARRLLADPKAKDALNDFHLQWLEIGTLSDLPKDATFTNYSPQVAQSMLKETREFVSSVFLGPKADGKLETLLTSSASFADASLGKIYGLKGVTGADVGPVALDPAQRAGILTQATFMTAKADASESHPIKRGDSILRRLFCIELKAPMNINIPPLPEPQPGQTTRERVSMHSMSPCASCHVLIDPVGFAFENYDAIGVYRTTEEGKPVDASGDASVGSASFKFKNAVEFVGQMAKSKDVQDCMGTQWMRYVMKRRELPTEEASRQAALAAFSKSSFDLRELLVALTKTRSFTHRALSAGEVAQ